MKHLSANVPARMCRVGKNKHGDSKTMETKIKRKVEKIKLKMNTSMSVKEKQFIASRFIG